MDEWTEEQYEEYRKKQFPEKSEDCNFCKFSKKHPERNLECPRHRKNGV